jgi:hypothetical protein
MIPGSQPKLRTLFANSRICDPLLASCALLAISCRSRRVYWRVGCDLIRSCRRRYHAPRKTPAVSASAHKRSPRIPAGVLSAVPGCGGFERKETKLSINLSIGIVRARVSKAPVRCPGNPAEQPATLPIATTLGAAGTCNGLIC